MDRDHIVNWLMSGDPSIAYQTKRDLLGQDDPGLQALISMEGWGQAILSKQHPDSSWGKGFYQPKWTSTHYSLLDLKELQIPQDNPQAKAAIAHILATEKLPDGGLGPAKTIHASDLCVAGMFLNYACYFRHPQQELKSLVDFSLSQELADGGYNCRLNRSGARHSSVHSTLSMLEGIEEYRRQGYSYRLEDLLASARRGREFLLRHRLYKSDRTGEIIHKSLLQFTYPARWKYNILRALDYFQRAGCDWDERMEDAWQVVLSKRSKDGRWLTAAQHPGERHLIMEPGRRPSLWNTLLAMRVHQRFRLPLHI